MNTTNKEIEEITIVTSEGDELTGRKIFNYLLVPVEGFTGSYSTKFKRGYEIYTLSGKFVKSTI